MVSYLYGEIGTGEKLRFEQHLESCHSCTDELSGFTLVRSAVREWREQEFLPMVTPAVEIPFETDSIVPQIPEAVGAPPSWLDQIRAFFKLSPVFMTAATGLAAIVICAGLLYIVYNSPFNRVDVARDEKINGANNTKGVSSPTGGINKSETTGVSSVSNTNQRKPESPSKSTTDEKMETVKDESTPIKVTMPVKPNAGKNPRQLSNTDNTTVKKPPTKSSKQNKRPSLTDDEDEDHTLRLSDLFEEVSLR